jgi:hypothetical protein
MASVLATKPRVRDQVVRLIVAGALLKYSPEGNSVLAESPLTDVLPCFPNLSHLAISNVFLETLFGSTAWFSLQTLELGGTFGPAPLNSDAAGETLLNLPALCALKLIGAPAEPLNGWGRLRIRAPFLEVLVLLPAYGKSGAELLPALFSGG